MAFSLRASPPHRCLMSCTEGLAEWEGMGGRLLRLCPPRALVLTLGEPQQPGCMPAALPTFLSALIGLSLNGWSILSFCKNPELQTPGHLLVLSLAVADSGISLNALVAATSSLLRYQPLPCPWTLHCCLGPDLWALGSQTRGILPTNRKLTLGRGQVG